jgi:hypothetical protein
MLYHRQVMRDEDHRQPQIALQFAQKVDHLRLDRHVQRRYRFVADHQLRFHDQRAGDADPLALTAGKLMRIAVDLVRQQADPFHHPLHARLDLGARKARMMRAQGFGDDLAHGHPRVQAGQGSWNTIWISRR